MKRLLLPLAVGFMLGAVFTKYFHWSADADPPPIDQASGEERSQLPSNDVFYSLSFDLAESRSDAIFSDETPDYSEIMKHDRFLADLTEQSRDPKFLIDEGWKKFDYGLYVFPGEQQ